MASNRRLVGVEKVSVAAASVQAASLQILAMAQYERRAIAAAAPCLVAPLEASRIVAKLNARECAVDRATWLLVPARSAWEVEVLSPTAQIFILPLPPALISQTVRAYAPEIEAARLNAYLKRVELFPRSTWINELCYRYRFELRVCGKLHSAAARFLSTELVKEVYFFCHERTAQQERASLLAQPTSLAQRALHHLETQLFASDVIAALPRVCGASASTLLRAFRSETGLAPAAYVRQRRLDEAQMLLKTGRYAVSEVAVLVGYESFAAFSAAYRKRFATAPSMERAAGRR